MTEQRGRSVSPEQEILEAMEQEVEAEGLLVALLLAGALIVLVDDDLFGLIGKD